MKIEGRINTNFFATRVFSVGQDIPVVVAEKEVAVGKIVKLEPTYYMYEAEVKPEMEDFVRDLLVHKKVPVYMMSSKQVATTKHMRIHFVIERLVEAVNGALANDPDALGGDILSEIDEINQAITALGVHAQLEDPDADDRCDMCTRRTCDGCEHQGGAT